MKRRITQKSGAARAATDPDKEAELLNTQHSAKTARPWLSPELTGSAILSKSHQAIAPLLWVSRCMEDAVDGHLPTSVLVKDGVWESPHQCPTILFVDFSVKFRHATNCLNTGVHTAEKLFPQTRSTIFVPIICLIDILLCFRRDYYFSVHSDFEPCVLHHPTKVPKPGCSSSWPFGEPTPPFAIHKQEPLTG